MKKLAIFILFVLNISLLYGCNGGGSSSELSTKEFLGDKFSAMIGDGDLQVPGLGVIVFKNGQTVYENFFGKRELDKNLPVTKDTRLRVASISKMFTMFGIIQLVEAGKIDLDEDVSTYLGFKLRNPHFPDEHCRLNIRLKSFSERAV